MDNCYNRGIRSGTPRDGSALLVGIVIVALVGLGVYYFLSDPFSTRVNESYRQATKWTAENIEKDKAGYLRWAIMTSEEQGEALRVRALSLRTMSNSIVRQAKAAEAKVASLNEFLAACRTG